jgi:SigmaK-factor processing regulatory protein BofA.
MAIPGLFVDIIFVILAIIIAYILYKVLKSVKKLAINIIVGFLLIIVSNWLIPGVSVPLFNLVTIIVTALTGAFGALILIILNIFGLFPF